MVHICTKNPQRVKRNNKGVLLDGCMHLYLHGLISEMRIKFIKSCTVDPVNGAQTTLRSSMSRLDVLPRRVCILKRFKTSIDSLFFIHLRSASGFKKKNRNFFLV